MSAEIRREAEARRAAARAYAKAQRPWYRRPLSWLGIFVVVMLFFTLPRQPGETSRPRTPPPQAAAPTALADAMPVTADQLFAALDENPLKAADTYLGTRIRVEGTLSNIDAQGKYFSIKGLDKAFRFDSIRLDIGPEHRASVVDFTLGQTVASTGVVKGVGEVRGFTIEVETIG